MIIALNLMTPSPIRAQTAIGGDVQVFTDMSLIESLTNAVLKQHEPGQRPNGTGSVNAGYVGGEMITKPFTFTGRRLVLNYATSAAGSIRVEIQDSNGVPKTGYALANFPERYLDEVEGVMKWGSVVDVGSLAGTTVRLRFVLQDADLYAMRFANPDNVQYSVSYHANGASGGTAPATHGADRKQFGGDHELDKRLRPQRAGGDADPSAVRPAGLGCLYNAVHELMESILCERHPQKNLTVVNTQKSI